MTRLTRRRLFALVGAGMVWPVRNAGAELRCGPWTPQGIQGCEAGLNSVMAHVSAAAVGGQHMPQWCWAACIEMVFRYYGFVVPQARVVSDTWGSIVNLPGQPQQILQNLNRPWVDQTGRGFQVSGDVFTANVMTAAQDLSQGFPLILGTMGHAMVLTAVSYWRNPYGNGEVTNAIVRDPWPGRGRRSLSAQEWYATTFLARIRVFAA